MARLGPLFFFAIAAALGLVTLFLHRRWLAENPPPALLALGMLAALALLGVATWLRLRRSPASEHLHPDDDPDLTIARWGHISFSGTPLAMLLLDPVTAQVVDANEAAARFYGYTRDQMRNLPASEVNLIAPQAIRAHLERTLNDGPQEFTVRQRRADGSTIEVAVTCAPLLSHGEKLVIALVQDITPQLRAEESFRHVTESSPAGLHTYALDNQGGLNLTAANPASEKILASPRPPLIGKPLQEVFAGPDAQSLQACLSEIARNGGHWSVENYDYRANEQSRIFGVTAFQVAPGQVGVMFVDTTDEHRHEQMLARSERRFRLLYERSPVGIALVDLATGRIQSANPACVEILGIDQAPLQSMLISELPSPEDEPPMPPELFTTASVRTMQRRFLRPDGNVRWLELTFCCMMGDATDADDDALIGLVIMHDITERRRAEEQLLDAKHAAERANAAKDQFLATLSHELRTPLTPVLLTTQSLQLDDSLSPTAREDLAAIQRNVELEARLIDDLLDLTRIVRGKMQLHRANIDLHHCIRSAVDICREDARKKGINLELWLEADAYTVHADSSRLHQVVWNLVKNAIKFTPNGGLIVVRTRNDRKVTPGGEPAKVLCEVVDNGLGMDQQTLDRIFVPFEQGSAQVTRLFGGLGMGLAISKAIVEMHHGEISAYSMGPGTGSMFTVSLMTTMAEGLAREHSPQPLAHASGAMTVLLVEDHEATARVLTRLLTRSGYRVINAADVASALAAASREKLDLLISDLGLPDGSGLDIVREVRQSHVIPAIAVSGYGMEQDIRNSLDAGFNEHLTKPVNLEALQNAIERVLASPDHVTAATPAVE